MQSWMPFWICLALALFMNLLPWFMAFVVKSKVWQQTGWVYYFATLPLGIVLIVLGVILSWS